jgi:two-component system, OmpR family, phosphate regulon sensor histidine kinase PhoR
LAAGYFLGRLPPRRGREPERETPAPATAEPDPRFEQLLRSLRVGVLLLDGNGRIAMLNAAAAAIFSLEARNVVGRSLIEVVPSFELDRRARAALDGHPSRAQLSINLAGKPRVLTVAALPVEGAGGALLIAADETRLHELEQMRSDFVANVSHELRTPLSSINLMIETILSTDRDEEALQLFLPRVKQEVDRMVQLVADLLDLAAVESGHLRLRSEVVDLSGVAARILETFEPRAAQAGVALRFSGERAPLRGDPDRLAQVIVNLVDNALRNTPAGGAIDVEVRRSGETIALRVRDTGVGIPFGDLAHVFERFYVVDRSRARAKSGTGLGLSIVKHIVEAHGGSASAQSELGYGATFTCEFPAEPATVAAG